MKVNFKDGTMETVLTLQEAVFMKGTKKQQQQFEKNNRLSTDALNSLSRAFEEEFESVRDEGKGKNKIFILREKRYKPIKLDGRQNNKATGRRIYKQRNWN